MECSKCYSDVRMQNDKHELIFEATEWQFCSNMKQKIKITDTKLNYAHQLSIIILYNHNKTSW